MKRTPLQRRTPLKSGKPLARTRAKRRPPPPGFTEETKARVRRRSGNRCEASSRDCTGRAEQFHHRKLRRHGDHTVENCLHVCTACHVRIHASPVTSYMMGWMVRSELDPGEVPVKRGEGG